MVDSPDQQTHLAGVEVKNLSLIAVLTDPKGVLSKTRTIELKPRKDLLSQLTDVIASLKKDDPEISSVGVAVPGLVDRKTGRVAFSANIPSHSDVDLVSSVAAETGLRVVIENDANAAAYGEFSAGSGRGSRNIFYATLGEGVGGAFIFDGKIWRGAAGFAGEFGHVLINSEGSRLEEVAAADSIIRRTRGRFKQDSTSSLKKFDESEIDLPQIITAAEHDDDFAQMMLERTGTYVGTAIASVINLLNIEKIVIGGEIMQAKKLVLKAIIERARELSFAPSFDSTSIVQGELGPNAAAIGAAFLTQQAE